MRPETSQDDQTGLKSEERRAIIWLSYFAIAVALRIEFERALALGQRPFLNFLCNYPCPHVTVYLVETLNILIHFWFIYTICILLYFSEDWFRRWGLRGRQTREVFRRLANFFIFTYPVLGGAAVLISGLSFLLPDWIQSAYWLLGFYVIGRVVVWLYELATGEKQTASRLAEANVRGTYVVAELLIEGLLPIMEATVRRVLKGKIPPNLRRLWLKSKRFLAKRRKLA